MVNSIAKKKKKQDSQKEKKKNGVWWWKFMIFMYPKIQSNQGELS